ncbi:MAG: hypothetical protein OSB10_08635, partial [Planctomycetota bacterium]|nr:hypothetical protein [Planctomycetota bacterium]
MTSHSNAFAQAVLATCLAAGSCAQNSQVRQPVADAAQTAAHSEANFTSVFNGIDLTGWTGDTSGYTAEDGDLVCLKEGGGNLYLAND